ncbi:unnamed protein product [Dovyalis caffra]|uniref:Uncharacterized protein n=1 Tax=Dovyalis caffra TaxID=77055 RepID=A0AAV1RTP0_9ROSI|nr:unnamed protein product [Dovyalis caffra]
MEFLLVRSQACAWSAYWLAAVMHLECMLARKSPTPGLHSIYSRTPNPGPAFIEKYRAYLANFGSDPSKIKDTLQDCEVMSNSKLAAMMSMFGMQKALTSYKQIS